jgi:hypothetical protein
LISRRDVLTAGHCVVDNNNKLTDLSSVNCYVGKHNLVSSTLILILYNLT